MVLQYISIALEAVIAFLGVLIAQKKHYGWFIFLTFIIYVFYDAAKLLYISVSNLALSVLFFAATLSAWYAVMQIYKDTKKK